MKKKAASTTKSVSKAKAFRSPLPTSSPIRPLDLTFLASASKKSKIETLTPTSIPSSPHPQILTTVADLKSLSSSRSDSLKRHLDLCHSEVLKEFDASHTRISKRFKIQTQACLQLTEEVEKEYKKMSDRIRENAELINASYVEFLAEAQLTASRACKVSVSELAQSMEKAIDSLRTRYKASSTPA
ncbi:uncharacterized protein [Typha angustifolia]|uniref:uncharacterized protein isoform X1 n=1 Tax=Typha angustifolia TaxID=59011 RepID=UPI003C30BDAB